MNKTLKETEKYILLLNDRIYLRMDNNGKYLFTKNYEYSFKTKDLTEISVLQSKYGGTILTLKEKITIEVNYV